MYIENHTPFILILLSNSQYLFQHLLLYLNCGKNLYWKKIWEKKSTGRPQEYLQDMRIFGCVLVNISEFRDTATLREIYKTLGNGRNNIQNGSHIIYHRNSLIFNYKFSNIIYDKIHYPHRIFYVLIFYFLLQIFYHGLDSLLMFGKFIDFLFIIWTFPLVRGFQ